VGRLGDAAIPPAGKPAGWQAGLARPPPRCGLGGGLPICLHVSGGTLSSRPASVSHRWLCAPHS